MLEPSIGKTKISGKYRVKQPIENFKIKVTIVQQKSLLAELFDNEGETRDSNFLEDEEYEFSWQEKVFGPYEAKYYRDERNCVTQRQKEYHRKIIDTADDGSRLYSYVHGDAYYPDVNLVTGKFRSCLSLRNEKALPCMKNKKPFGERYNKAVVDEKPSDRRIRENHYFYTERETMYIVVDLSPRDATNADSTDSEALLCAISYDPLHKCLRVNPDFTSDDCYSVDGIGMSYDFWIEHVSVKPTARELQRKREVQKREVHHLRSLKQSYLYHELHSPRTRVLRLYINLDILNALEFAYNDALFISYYIDLPTAWSSENKRLAGRTQRCRPGVDGKVNFSYCAEIVLDLDFDEVMRCENGDGNDDAGDDSCEERMAKWPTLLFAVASIDSWTRYRIEGYGTLALPNQPGSSNHEIRTWRPSAGIVDNLRRFFTGGTTELDDITYCSIPSMFDVNNSKVLDKSILKVVPSGKFNVKLNIVQQSQEFARYRNVNAYNFDKLNTGKLLNNVDDVLSQFKAARERMIQARAMCS